MKEKKLSTLQGKNKLKAKLMKIFTPAIVTMIFLIPLHSCKTSDQPIIQMEKPIVPPITDNEGKARVQLIDGTQIVVMDLDLWKQIVFYFVQTQEPSEVSFETEVIQDPIITKEQLLKRIE